MRATPGKVRKREDEQSNPGMTPVKITLHEGPLGVAHEHEPAGDDDGG